MSDEAQSKVEVNLETLILIDRIAASALEEIVDLLGLEYESVHQLRFDIAKIIDKAFTDRLTVLS